MLLTTALAAALLSCASAPTGPLGPGIGEPLSSPWTAELPAGWEGWELSTSPSCVLALGWSGPAEVEATRSLRCHDPGSGELRWEHTVPVKGGFIQDRLFVVDDFVVLINLHAAFGIDASSGELRWTFDPNERSIQDAVVRDDRVFLNLDRRVLCVLDRDSGRWQRGIRVGGRRLVDVASTSDGDVALLLSEHKDGARVTSRALLAVEVDGEGGHSIEPPWATMTTRWSQEIGTQSLHLGVLDGVVVGALSQDTLWGIDAASGEILYQEPTRERPPQKRAGWVARRRGRPPQSDLHDLDDLLQTGRIAPDTRFLIEDGSTLISQRAEVGLVLDMLHLERRDPRTLDAIWSLALGWKDAVQTRRELQHTGIALIANRRQLAFIDLDTGALLAEKHLNRQGRRYKAITSDGRAIYFVFSLKKKARIEGHPL